MLILRVRFFRYVSDNVLAWLPCASPISLGLRPHRPKTGGDFMHGRGLASLAPSNLPCRNTT